MRTSVSRNVLTVMQLVPGSSDPPARRKPASSRPAQSVRIVARPLRLRPGARSVQQGDADGCRAMGGENSRLPHRFGADTDCDVLCFYFLINQIKQHVNYLFTDY